MSSIEEPGDRSALVQHWLAKAVDAIESARLEHEAGHQTFAVNRAYYACFYAATALLLSEGQSFARHSGVLSQFQRSYVKTGRIPRELGQFYRRLFNDRQLGDYTVDAEFRPEDVAGRIATAEQFVSQIRRLVAEAL